MFFRKRKPAQSVPFAEITRLLASKDKADLDRFRGQHGEDRFIFEQIRQNDPPGVVDVGANDGYSWSNSHLLGQLGMRLLLIEPMPDYAEKCRRLYPNARDVTIVEAAIDRQAGESSFFVNLDEKTDLLAMRSSLTREIVPSDLIKEIKVKTSPLSALLKEHNWPHDYLLLSIDAEGFDPIVLETADLERYRPRIICVEEEVHGDLVPNFLARFGYNRLTQLGPNGMYRRSDV